MSLRIKFANFLLGEGICWSQDFVVACTGLHIKTIQNKIFLPWKQQFIQLPSIYYLSKTRTEVRAENRNRKFDITVNISKENLKKKNISQSLDIYAKQSKTTTRRKKWRPRQVTTICRNIFLHWIGTPWYLQLRIKDNERHIYLLLTWMQIIHISL